MPPASDPPADAATPSALGAAADVGVEDGAAGFHGDAATLPDPTSDGAVVDAGYTDRINAATATANGHADCVMIKPFYWEIGDSTASRASGSLTKLGSATYDKTSTMSIASASKWIYSTYWVERTNGALSTTDIEFFNFRSGYTNFSSCKGTTTVGACLASAENGTFDPATHGKFAYGGGHMQKHAADSGLATLDNAALAAEMQTRIGTDIAVSYGTPQLAGGAVMSAGEYAKLLRKIVGAQLKMHAALGTFPVCTNPATCAAAVNAPLPSGEQWHYSIGHWVEDDPTVGDGAFSSPGAFGFYPWIDASKTYYGIVARSSLLGAIDSVKCGRRIRKAWLTATAQ